MKIGDKVQFLSEIGGGKIAGFQGKDIALVEDEDGFQIPTPISDLVVTGIGEEYSSLRSAHRIMLISAPRLPDELLRYWLKKTSMSTPVTYWCALMQHL